MMTLRTVVFTNKSARGAEILRQMKKCQIPIEAIVIDTTRWNRKNKGKKARRTLNRFGLVETAKYAYKKLAKTIQPPVQKSWKLDQFYKEYSETILKVENFNNEQCETFLKENKPDLIILGGARIIRANIIRIPKYGILNAHPGLLPEYRGVDVIPWAIHNGDPIGVTLHFIDAGIDTGNIVSREEVPIVKGDTFGSLMKKANKIAGRLVCEAIIELSVSGKVRTITQKKSEGTQYFRMPPNLRIETANKLERMGSALDKPSKGLDS